MATMTLRFPRTAVSFRAILGHTHIHPSLATARETSCGLRRRIVVHSLSSAAPWYRNPADS